MTLKKENHVVVETTAVPTVVNGASVGASSQAEKKLAEAEAKVVKMLLKAKEQAAKIVERANTKAGDIAEAAEKRKLAQAEKAKKKAEKAKKDAEKTVLKEKKQYKVRNWAEYTESLRKRGEIGIYLSPELITAWQKVQKKK